jgi:hypothetical protein
MITAATPSSSHSRPFDPQTLAIEADQYFYPLVLMDLTRRQSTNVEQWDGQTAFAPMNPFGHTDGSLDFTFSRTPRVRRKRRTGFPHLATMLGT